jgi:hypothetical protein
MNVPSIHGGKSFNEDELRLMIKQGNLQPTSVHKSRADAEAAAQARSSSMVPGPRNMANGGVIGKPGGVVEPGVMYYGKNVMSGSPAQQAENIRRQKESLKKISDLFKKKDYTGLKLATRPARIEAGTQQDTGGKLNTNQQKQIKEAIDGGLKTQNAFAKKLGITHKELLEGIEKSKSKIASEKSETMSKKMLKKIEFQEKLFKEIVDNPKATVDSMMKKFKVDKKYLVSQSSKLLKNVYSQNVSIAKGPEFDLDSRGKATLKSWLPNNFDTTEKFLDRFANIDGFKKIQTENMGKLLFNAYGKTDPKKYTDAMKALTEYNNFRNNLPKGLNVDLDHPLSKVFLKGSGVSPDKLLYVTPVNRDFNRGFKMQIGNRYAKALLQGDKTAIKNVRALADKLKINIGDVKGSKLDFGTTKFDTKKNFGKEYMANIKEQTTVADELNKLQKTKKGRQFIKDAGFKSGQIKEVQKITKGVISQLEKLGCGKAAGGRILMSNGGATLTKCARKGQKVLEQGLKNGFKESDQVLARGILKSGRFLKDAVSLRGLFGPAALAFTAAAEAGIVGYGMLSSGKSFREAIGDSLFNYVVKGTDHEIDSEEEFIKRLKNIKTGPSGLRDFSDEEIGKMQYFKENLKDMGTGFDLYKQLENIKDRQETERGGTQSDLFSENTFQLDAAKDKIQADIQDYNRTNTPNRVTDYLLSDEATVGGDAAKKAALLVKQDQLQDAGTGKWYQAGRGDDRRRREAIDTKFQLEQMYNPTKYNENAEYFMGLPKSEQSKLMSYENMLHPFREKFMSMPKSQQSKIMSYGYSEGGITGLRSKYEYKK